MILEKDFFETDTTIIEGTIMFSTPSFQSAAAQFSFGICVKQKQV